MNLKLLQFYKRMNIDFTIKINGSCMIPTITDNQIVTIIQTTDYNINDIILFYQNDNLYIHRIVNIICIENEKHYITKADNNYYEDKAIKKTCVFGKLKLV